MKLEERATGAANVTAIAMGEDDAVEPIYTPGSKVGANHAVVVAERSGVEQPFAFRCPNVNGATGFQIEDVDFHHLSIPPMGVLNVRMAARDLGEDVNGPQNNFRQEPIGIVENAR